MSVFVCTFVCQRDREKQRHTERKRLRKERYIERKNIEREKDRDREKLIKSR